MYAHMARFGVGIRLAVAFCVLMTVSLLITADGWWIAGQARQHIDRLVLVNAEQMRLAAEMLDARSRIDIALRDRLLTLDDDTRPVDDGRVAQQLERLNRDRVALSALPMTEPLRTALAGIEQASSVMQPLAERFEALLENQDATQAHRLLSGEIEPAMEALQAAIESNRSLIVEGTAAAHAEASIAVRNARFTLIVGGFGVLFGSAVMGWFITRSLTQPLAHAKRVAEAIADGRFDQACAVDGRDEPSQLLASMARMQAQLRRFSHELKTLIHLHSTENLSHRMPEDFPGEYGVLAAGVNTAVFEHVDCIRETIALMQAYGRGDLSVDARRLPGERAVLHEALDAIKANLIAVSRAIRQLADAAAAGDFSQRGEDQRFESEFQAMIQALNRLMAEADSGLSDVGGLMRSLASGDLTRRLDTRHRGEFARLVDDANRTADGLTSMIGAIQRAACSIDSAAGEIASGNANLSLRTEQQAASLEETASSMEQMTTAVRQNAASAARVEVLAQRARDTALDGGRVVRGVIGTMDGIRRSSQRIADIIGVIDGIAFQTNILALNAAVEAARAGEQGAGFAVVASEVRQLAKRSATAATEIKSLIADSVSCVSDGVDQAGRAGVTMDEIVAAVSEVTGIVGDISRSSANQSQGIEQVGQTIGHLEAMTQQNAAMVEQAATSAASLAQQAASLLESVSAFTLIPGSVGSAAPAADGVIQRRTAAG